MEDPLLVEPERLKKWFVELSRQSLAPFTDQYLDKHRAALWLLDRQLLSEANSLLQLPRPVLYSYQADTTSFKTRVQTDTRGNSEQHSLHRRGRELAELLSEKAFLKTIGDDGIAVFMVLCSCARILRDGKTADVHFTALLEFGRKLILEHRWAITLRHHCYDRAVFEPVMRRVIAHRAARYAPEMELLGIVERYEQEPLDIVTGIACAAHDASNSLKWGVARMLREPTWVDDLFIGIESLRNSYVSLYAHLDEHLAKVVLFDGEQTEDFTRKWWSFMGVCVSWLDLFAEVRPYSQGGFLHVNPALLHEEEEVKKTIHSKKGYIEGICSAARLEMYFLDAAADIITDVVHDNVLNCLPTSTLKEHPSLDKSIVKLSELQRSQLVRRSTSVLESELVSIKTLLLNMQRGMSPTVDGTVSEFYKTVVDRCSNFFNNTLWEPAEKGPSERPYLSGKAAKTNYFEHLAAKTAEDHGSVTAHDIELLRPYWWLLIPDEVISTQKYLQAAIKKATDSGKISGASSAKATSVSPAKPGAQKPKRKDASSSSSYGAADKKAALMRLFR
jgi:hypothetical protein